MHPPTDQLVRPTSGRSSAREARDDARAAGAAEERLIPGWVRERVRPVVAFAMRRPTAVEMSGILLLLVFGFVSLLVQRRLTHLDADLFCLLLPLGLLLRRRSLRGAFALTSLAALTQWFLSTPQNADVAVLVAFFWVMLDGDLETIVVASCVVELGAALVAVRWAAGSERDWIGITGLAIAFGAVGLVIRERRALLVSMRERAARLELERDQEGRLGAAAERARIAREMHDIVSHNLTVVVGLADGAAYALAQDPDSTRDALDSIAATGRQALGDMRRLLGVLHEERSRGAYEPQPGLDRLTGLLERIRAAGVPVDAQVQGRPEELPDGVQLALYRVAQEALTNTLRHAGRPVRAQLLLRCLADRVELAIDDTGTLSPAPAAGLGLPRGGRGLAGMQERAGAFGGELSTGPRPDGAGWRVRLTLPLGAVAGAASR